MKLPRFIHRIWAWYRGYSWSECPVCGEYFGAHEAGWLGLITGLRKGMAIERTVCAKQACQAIADQQHTAYWRAERRREVKAVKARQCTGKVRHATKRAACIAISKEERPFGLNAYKCPFCQSWHVGHNYPDRKILNSLRDRCVEA